MNAHWVVAKYMPDLRRREQTNIGVILKTGRNCNWRFRGVSPSDGKIDGRKLRGVVESFDSYRSWYAYWTRSASRLGGESLTSLIKDNPNSNYSLEFGGEMLRGVERAPNDLLEHLYMTLVDDDPAPETLSVATLADRVVRSINTPTPISRDVELSVPVAHDRVDRVKFHYRYDNGQPNLMRRVSLAADDERSWREAHASTWAFEKAGNSPELRPAQFIALVKQRQATSLADELVLQQQVEVLGAYATVVDVSLPQAAAERLAGLLHVGLA